MKHRIIKFKAKRLDNNEWITGDLLQMSEKDVQIYNKDCGGSDHPVNPSTVCQFTGLKDKGGKEIWENDYIREAEGTWQVEFYKGAFVLGMGDGDYRPLHDFYCGNDFCLKEALNVGNKFDRKEEK